ncbi:MAG: outer membrane protein [Parvibaculales bacterium]
MVKNLALLLLGGLFITGAAHATETGFYMGFGYGGKVVKGQLEVVDDIAGSQARDLTGSATDGPLDDNQLSVCSVPGTAGPHISSVPACWIPLNGDKVDRGFADVYGNINLGYGFRIHDKIWLGAEFEWSTGKGEAGYLSTTNQVTYFQYNSKGINLSALLGYVMNDTSMLFTTFGLVSNNFILNHPLGYAPPASGAATSANPLTTIDDIKSNEDISGFKLGFGVENKLSNGLSLRLAWNIIEYDDESIQDGLNNLELPCNLRPPNADRGRGGNLSGLQGGWENACDGTKPEIQAINDLFKGLENNFNISLVYRFGDNGSTPSGASLKYGAYVFGELSAQAGAYDRVRHRNTLDEPIGNEDRRRNLSIDGSASGLGVGFDFLYNGWLLGIAGSYRLIEAHSQNYGGFDFDFEQKEEGNIELQIGRALNGSNAMFFSIGYVEGKFNTAYTTDTQRNNPGAENVPTTGSVLHDGERESTGWTLGIGAKSAITDHLFLQAKMDYTRYEDFRAYFSQSNKDLYIEGLENFRFSLGVGYSF